MISRLKKLLLCSLCLLSPMTQALTLNARLMGDELVWQNGMRVEGALTSTNWQILGGLAPTTEWAPGTFLAAPPTEMTLSNGAHSVTIPVEVKGMQYGLGAAADKFPDQVTTPSGGSCDSFRLQPAIASVVGSGCVADNAYQGTTLYTPFQFARPLVAFDDAALVNAFRAASLPEGTYIGTIVTSPFYMYRSQGGAWTYRQFGPTPLSVQIRYVPAFLTNVQVLGNGVMTPTYDTVNYSVSGDTTFKVQATGLFTSGVKLTFEERAYELKHFDLDKRIAYNVTCPACADTNIVQDGILKLASHETTVPGSGSFVAFDLLVHFDASASEVETGHYVDSMVVYFEENL
ncbi:hypothetical protein HUO05_25840 (plasmid) [Vibrio alginolyticus]|uniref:hypothetical protein n=1 Tax=Vibrio alginolyticus TaxID=663 RepID=UPI001593701F|nr:hypothetical protein [Vibrio alginolyticus]QKS98627.1 hypothetical protein HUO05_25840 [Vibrio alginolyticus]